MPCPGSPELTLGEVYDELLMQLGTRRYPLGGTFEITERCNLACTMCYINQPAGSREAAARELTLPQVRGILDQLADAGCLALLITGGEPLLRADFCDIWRYAKQKGFLICLYTNGTLLDERMADFLAEWRPLPVEITLYGATQATYESVTRTPGSHARCMRGIELALERGLRLSLKTTLSRVNYHELGAMVDLAAGLGVPYRFDGVLFSRLDGDHRALDQRLSPAEVVALDNEYSERQREFDRLFRAFGGTQVRSDYVYSCGAGHRSFHIDCKGQMSACMLARRPSYGIIDSSFQIGWNQFIPTLLRRKRTQDVPCIGCEAGALCIQCPGMSQLAHGDDETIVDYICEMGRLRAAQARASAAGGEIGGPLSEFALAGDRQVGVRALTGPSDAVE